MNRLASPRVAALAIAIAVTSVCATAQAQSDPLFKYQWHLRNFGNAQTFFADTKGVYGIDLRIDSLHRYNIRGEGVVIGVVDDGMQIAHPDLAANVAPVAGKNFANGSNDPSPTLGRTYAGMPIIDNHGTMVSGIIGAVGDNRIGVRGVAPKATMKGFNFLASDAQGNQGANYIYSWWEGAEAQDVDVFNNSWGSAPFTSVTYSEATVAAFERAMSSTRDGLGGIYVKSAGNSFRSLLFLNLLELCSQRTRDLNVGCTENSRDPLNNLFNVITVTAATAAGDRSSYSSPGSAAWVSGFGGEFAYARAYRPAGENLVDFAYDPAIVTIDTMGCTYGANVSGARRNALNDGDKSVIDNTCNYTATMNGTSAAAPTVSGVAALMLEANPRLSFRDVKYILATTARRINPGQPAATLKGTVLVPGWVTNAAGHPYSNWYGFGLVDAQAAVIKAGSFNTLPALKDSGWRRTAEDAKAVPIGGPGAPARFAIDVADGAGAIESVQLGLKLSGIDGASAQVELVSPSGTRSVIKPAYTTILLGTFSPDFVSSNAFLDEPGKGTWTLEVTDMNLGAGDKAVGALNSFKIRVLGH